jgi:hypothetical protein
VGRDNTGSLDSPIHTGGAIIIFEYMDMSKSIVSASRYICGAVTLASCSSRFPPKLLLLHSSLLSFSQLIHLNSTARASSLPSCPSASSQLSCP